MKSLCSRRVGNRTTIPYGTSSWSRREWYYRQVERSCNRSPAVVIIDDKLATLGYPRYR